MASSNRVVIVTGASQGIGKAVSLHLVSQGVSVVGIARSAPALHGVSQEARQRHAGAGSQFIPVIGTIADESTQQRAVDLATEHGTLVALINNAATADPLKPLASASLAALETHYKCAGYRGAQRHNGRYSPGGG
ncbi:NAD(P)-binding protein [Martensiomyces pterosporus]|nr:NAD(P)-binding protein [Martensiomyces pterosporus]